MNRFNGYLSYAEGLHVELQQCADEGRDTAPFQARAEAIRAMPAEDPARETLAKALIDEINALPADNGFDEPDALEDILAARPANHDAFQAKAKPAGLYDRIYGAWLGRCAGCLLGKPFEGWMKARMDGFLKATGNFPLARYAASDVDEKTAAQYQINRASEGWVNNVAYMPEDDDTNYTLISLALLERFGADFTTEDVAEMWLRELPALHVFTAERVVYRNLLNLVDIQDVPSHYNPYREWIGAQIRTDFYGYINPGDPECAARMGYVDGTLSHVKNGVYGAMFVPAMLAHAAVCADMQAVLEAGLSQVPERSRLTSCVREVMAWHGQGLSYTDVIARIHGLWDEANPHHWCHVLPNAMIVVMGLLYGGDNLGRTISIAVEAGFDTDCNGATAGSIVGMMRGAQALDAAWIDPLHDRLLSGVSGLNDVKISAMAKRTQDLAL